MAGSTAELKTGLIHVVNDRRAEMTAAIHKEGEEE